MPRSFLPQAACAAVSVVGRKGIGARVGRDVALNLPALHTPGDAGEVSASILAAVTKGEITIGEATELARLVAAHVATLESSERYDTEAAIFPGLG